MSTDLYSCLPSQQKVAPISCSDPRRAWHGNVHKYSISRGLHQLMLLWQGLFPWGGQCRYVTYCLAQDLARSVGYQRHIPPIGGLAMQGRSHVACSPSPAQPISSFSSHPSFGCSVVCVAPAQAPGTMRFGSTAQVLLERKLKYYRISGCLVARHCLDSFEWGCHNIVIRGSAGGVIAHELLYRKGMCKAGKWLAGQTGKDATGATGAIRRQQRSRWGWRQSR